MQESIREVHTTKALSSSAIVELIDKILVHEGGKITIKVKYADAFEAMLDCIEQQKEIA